MKKRNFFSLILIILMYGCKSEFAEFNDEALTFANTDKRIDQKEYEYLIEQVKQSDEKVLIP